MWTIRPHSSQLWYIRQNSSHVKNPTEFLTPIFADNAMCKIFDRLYQTWEIHICGKIDRIHTSCDILDRIHHMWKIRANFSHLYSPKISRVKYSTYYVKREDFNDILHGWGNIDLICTICDILDRKRHMWKLRPNFSHLYSPQMCHLFDIWPNIAHVSNFIEFFLAVKIFHRIHHSHDKFDRIHHMWKFRPKFSHLYSPKISHLKYPTKYIKREEFDRIRHKCEQLVLIRHSYDIFDKIHHMWKIRPNFSHLYSPIMPLLRYLTDYIKR